MRSFLWSRRTALMAFRSDDGNTPKGKWMTRNSPSKIKLSWGIRGELDPKLLCFLWFAGGCVIGTSIFAIHILSTSGLQFSIQEGSSLRNPQKGLTVTIFTAPDPFEGSVGKRQTLAIDSWLRLDPCPNVVLLGKHSSVIGFVSNRANPNLTVDTDLDFTFDGKALFHGMVGRALRCPSDIVVLIDPDLMLFGRAYGAIRSMINLEQDWLIAALPLVVTDFSISLPGRELSAIGAQDEEEVPVHVQDHGIWDTCDGAQLWAWNGNPTPLHIGVMPPFAYREGHHNQWLLSEAMNSKFRVVLDASEALNVFRTHPPWNSSSDTRSTIEAGNGGTGSNGVFDIGSGNSWLASTYGSHFFRGSNFSDIPLKLMNCGVLQEEKLCVVNVSGNSFSSCSYLSPQFTARTDVFRLLFDLFASWVRVPVGRKRNGLVAKTCHISHHKAHGLNWHSTEAVLVPFPNKKGQNMKCGCTFLPYQNNSIECIGSKSAGSQIGSGFEESGSNPRGHSSMEELVRRVANEDKVVILAVVGNTYRDFLMSWVCRLRHLNLSNFLVSALDDDLFQFASHQGLPVFRSDALDMNVTANDCHFGSTCFQRVTKMKSRTVLQILKLGFHVLLSDVDIYWFEDPLEELMSFGPAHLPAQTDQWNETEALNVPRKLNSGFYLAWADNLTIAAFEAIVKHGEFSKKSEQPSFYDVLCGEGGKYRVGGDMCTEPTLNMTVHFLDPVSFPNGAFRLLWDQKDVRRACEVQGCKILHNNWVPGRQRKLDRQVASGLWDYDAVTRTCIRHAEKISYLERNIY